MQVGKAKIAKKRRRELFLLKNPASHEVSRDNLWSFCGLLLVFAEESFETTLFF